MGNIAKYWPQLARVNFGKIFIEHFEHQFHSLNSAIKEKAVEITEDMKVYFLENTDRLKPTKRKKILALDLDETLLHCKSYDKHLNSAKKFQHPDKIVIMQQPKYLGGLSKKGYVFLRPNVIKFLKKMSELYEVVIYTASQKHYCYPIVDAIDPERKWIKGIFTRDHCIVTDNNYYVKDLRIFAERNLNEIVLVDNSSSCFVSNLDNGIPIIPFYDNKDDNELNNLSMFLVWLNEQEDVQDVLRNIFFMKKYCLAESPIQLFNQIFKSRTT